MNYNLLIKHAVYDMGGPTNAAIQLLVSPNTVQQWIRKGNIPNLRSATKVAEATGIDVKMLRRRQEQALSNV